MRLHVLELTFHACLQRPLEWMRFAASGLTRTSTAAVAFPSCPAQPASSRGFAAQGLRHNTVRHKIEFTGGKLKAYT